MWTQIRWQIVAKKIQFVIFSLGEEISAKNEGNSMNFFRIGILTLLVCPAHWWYL